VKKVTILAELTCLNKLVNGKVIVIDRKSNTYKTYNQGKFTPPMPDVFNLEDYALLKTEHCPVVVVATPKMKEEYMVNKLFKEQYGSDVNFSVASIDKKKCVELDITYSIYDSYNEFMDDNDGRDLPF